MNYRNLTYKIVKSFNNKKIKIYKLRKNIGRTNALNYGLKKCKTKYTAILDADDISSTHRLKKQISFLEKNKQFQMVGSWAYLIDSYGKKIGSKNNFTRKRRYNNKIKNEKVETFLNSMEGLENSDDSNLADFNPPPQPELTQQNQKEEENENENENEDNIVQPEAYNNLTNNAVTDEYYKQFIPYFTQANNSPNLHGSKDVLLEKLNYMIHMLEEQKDVKNGNTTEELILYLFLGVFVIFVVDSFARAGKYTR